MTKLQWNLRNAFFAFCTAFIPNKETRRRFRLNHYKIKHVTMQNVNNAIPREVLEKINNTTNEEFYTLNNGGGNITASLILTQMLKTKTLR
ncbi:MAG: hypothetical protein SOW25_02415 [Helicobacter sp.]|nr:hypothetical protein [Helicobacter sp.]